MLANRTGFKILALFAAALAISTLQAAEQSTPESNDSWALVRPEYAESWTGRYNYNFPEGYPTPFDKWQNLETEDAETGEFAAMFAAKLMTVIQSVEDVPGGKKAYIIIAGQNCILDIAVKGNERRVRSSKCSVKPWGSF